MQIQGEERDLLAITPLGAGQEVGRSCIMAKYHGKSIMLDCGIHPGLISMDALSFFDLVNTEDICLLLVSHFHLDHCGALPWFLLKTRFKVRCFMTHASKEIYRLLVTDTIKISSEKIIYTKNDLEASMNKIETVPLHEINEVVGVKFTAYNAGHVLSAAMFMLEIDGLKILYTGDFSRQESHHLMAAEIPTIRPYILITEATCGKHIHEKREEKDGRFTSFVHEIVSRRGICLIPAAAVGLAQELFHLLEEYWDLHPNLNGIPIYYASSLSKKYMNVYQKYKNAISDKLKPQSINNPSFFTHISYVKNVAHFKNIGPCVVIATPGMMQGGLSRDLFESWCTDSKNGIIISGYCAEGTLAKTILYQPEEIKTSSGQKLRLNMSIAYIPFPLHPDYQQTSEFIGILKPPHVVLVHGKRYEMSRLKSALQREYQGQIQIYNPKNTEPVELSFINEKVPNLIK